MPNQSIAMRKIHEILRLRFDVGLSFRQISQCADVSTGAIQKMFKRLEGSPVSCLLPDGMSDVQLARQLYPESDSQPGALEDHDWPVMHMELQRKGVTCNLLWEEYCQQMPVRAYSYSQFCCRYQDWCQKQKRSMRRQQGLPLRSGAESDLPAVGRALSGGSDTGTPVKTERQAESEGRRPNR